MNPLTLLLIRLAFLAVLWLFVIAAVGVVRTDLFGSARPGRQRRQRRRQRKPGAAQAPSPPGRGQASRGSAAAALVTAGGLAGHHHRSGRPANHHWPGE